MKISIVTISFNQKRFLRQCIDSILSQKGCELEHIIVDPGSTDGSRELIDSYGDRVVKVFSPDEGPADGLNKGFSYASGEVYGFINSDDYLLPNALLHVSEYFNSNGMRRFVTGQGYTENVTGQRTNIRPRVLTAHNMLHRSAVMFQQATFFPASAYKDVGGFNIENPTCWDYELFLRFLQRGLKHDVIAEKLAAFRLHETSISGSGRLTQRHYAELDRLFKEVYGRPRGPLDKTLTWILRIQRELAGYTKLNHP